MYNFWSSAAVEHVAMQTKAPYVASVRAVDGHQQEWDNANIQNKGYLPYNDIDEAGRPIERPERSQPPVMAQAYPDPTDSAEATRRTDSVVRSIRSSSSSVATPKANQATMTLSRRNQKAALVAGIGGLELGLHQAGHETIVFSEVWAPAAEVLARRFDSVPNVGDVANLKSLLADKKRS